MSGETVERIVASMGQYVRVSLTNCTVGGSTQLFDPMLVENLTAYRDDTAVRDPLISGVNLDPLV